MPGHGALQGNLSAPLVLGTGSITPPFVFDIGRPNCYADDALSRCTVPYISAEFDQNDPLADSLELLRPGWYDLELQVDGALMFVQDAPLPDALVPELLSRGMVDLASGPDGFRGVIGDRRYELERAPGEGATEAPALDALAFAAGDWPLRIGSQKFAANETTYRIAARRPGALCGNGELDCDEACDDGNTVDDDGCSASCSLESGPTTGL